MAHGRLRILRAIPGSTALRPIVRDFCRPGQGVVTAFSDAVLLSCRSEVDEDGLVEVVSFGELVRSFLELSGEEALRIAPHGHSLAAIADACLELPEDSPFRRTARFPGTHEALWKTLHELAEWGLFADDFAALADLCDARLGAKLQSLAILDRESRRILNSLGLESHARQLQACLESAPETDGSYEMILCFAGSEEAPLKMRWLKWAVQHGTDVTIVLDRHATDGKVFRGADRATAFLGGPEEKPGDANRLLRNLFSVGEHGGAPIEVVISSSPDPLAESEWAVREVLANGSPDQAAIYTRNLEAYAPLVEAAAKRLGVPIRMSRRAPLITNALTRLTLTALDFIGSTDVRSIGPVLQSSYLGLTGVEQAMVAEGLKECHRTRELQWLTLRTWAETHEDGFGWLLKLLEWRHENLSASRTLSEWYSRLPELIDKVLPVLTHADLASEYSQERDRRARNQMLRLLAGEASVANVTERGAVTLGEFARICHRLWSSADVSVPSGEYGACVTANPECLDECETLVVVGMLEGVFPRRRTEDPILTDTERETLSDLLPSSPRLRTSRNVAEEERDAFYRVCAAPKKRLLLSYPQADDTRDNVPAFYLELVRNAQGDVRSIDHPRSQIAPPLETCLAEKDRELRMAMDGPKATPLPVEVKSEEVLATLRTDQKGVGPDELRDAQRCPFMHLSRHRLRLRPKRTSARWASLRQLPHTATLVRQATPELAEQGLMNALESHLDSIYSEVPDWELKLLQAGGKRLVAEWVRREFLARRIWPRQEESVKLNVGFGTHGIRNELWGGIELDGVVPAVSQIDNIKVAHLYSGTSRDADRLTETDRMHLGLYFAALHESGKESAVEVETMSGRRTLYTLTRSGARPLASNVGQGLHVVDLAAVDDTATAKKIFYEEVRRLVRQAAGKIREGSVHTTPGDACDWCDYGELCRRNRAFGEEDSPFGRDEEALDGG